MADQTLHGTNENDTLNGGGGADVLIGGGGNDKLYGHGGADIFGGGNGVDRFYGGEGVDTISYNVDGGDTDGNGFQIELNLGWTRYIEDNGPPSTEDFFESIENAVGSTRADRIYGSSDNNLLVGGGGRDFVYGRDGNDILSGGGDVDTLDGGKGVDTVNYAIDKEDANGYGGSSGFDINLNVGLTRRVDNLSVHEDTLISIENAVGSDLNDRITGTDKSNLPGRWRRQGSSGRPRWQRFPRRRQRPRSAPR